MNDITTFRNYMNNRSYKSYKEYYEDKKKLESLIHIKANVGYIYTGNLISVEHKVKNKIIPKYFNTEDKLVYKKVKEDLKLL